ncbi:MAG: hypothetical protein LBD43_00995 [Holosporales bacterium]|jgi:hypothetical protein|nr:hypothetical protein [Holosporales bacterium]
MGEQSVLASNRIDLNELYDTIVGLRVEVEQLGGGDEYPNKLDEMILRCSKLMEEYRKARSRYVTHGQDIDTMLANMQAELHIVNNMLEAARERSRGGKHKKYRSGRALRIVDLLIFGEKDRYYNGRPLSGTDVGAKDIQEQPTTPALGAIPAGSTSLSPTSRGCLTYWQR